MVYHIITAITKKKVWRLEVNVQKHFNVFLKVEAMPS